MVDTVIDTGFSGFLSLPSAIIVALNLPWSASDIATLGDGSETLFDLYTALDDRFDYGEDRWFGIGFLGFGIAVLVWTERRENVIRIISARRANRHEQKRLEQYLSY